MLVLLDAEDAPQFNAAVANVAFLASRLDALDHAAVQAGKARP